MDTIIVYLNREGYSPNQIHNTITVGELIEELQQYDEDTKICAAFDGGYTYGSFITNNIRLEEWGEDDE